MSKFSGFGYDFINLYNARLSPSTVHTRENDTTAYFKRYLLQKIISVYEFTGIPDHWAKNYFLYTLFIMGNVAVINTDKFGIIPQHGSLFGYNVFYQPTHFQIANPLLRGNLEPMIGRDCTLIKLQPDYGSCWDIVSYYADMLSLCTETLGVNLINSKLAYVFACENKATAESFKELYDEIARGNPAAFADKHLFNDDGSANWEIFGNNLKNNYLVENILQDMTKIDARFCTDVGIPNINMAKESGVTDNEVESNNIDTKTKASLWLETIREGLDSTNDMFKLDLGVKFRFGGNTNEQIMAISDGGVSR